MPHVTKSIATVYGVEGERRFLSKRAAYRRAARVLIRERHWIESDCTTLSGGVDQCYGGIDLEDEYLARLTSRLARFLRFVDRRSEG